jgi:signal transduction histidine kinase/CheY-like chemotaxis protein
MSNTDWSVLLFVPTAVLGANTNRFMTVVILYFLGVAAAVILIFAFLIFAAIANRNDKRLMAHQQEANALLSQAAEEARSASAAKSEFLSHMSHDIRTPINGIIGMTNIAIKNIDSIERVNDCLHKISGAADHLLTLINDVLDMSRIESGKTEIAHESMDIRVLIDNCASIVSGQLLSRKVEFVCDFEDFPHPYLYGDELHLRQVFINILGNAVKFTPDDGTITFRVREEGCAEEGRTVYRFEIADTGIGMSEEYQTKIFEAFSQEDNGSRTNYKGTGLGMAITKQFVDLMGGTITVHSKLGEGSRFIVELTFDIDTAQHEEHAQLEQVDLTGMRVLLVEDNELNLEIAEEILKDEEIDVTCAENGRAAVDTFLSMPPGSFDAILMDVMMPEMNGYEATKAIRSSSHPQAESIPIIAMTANAYAEDVQTALASGMNAHVSKPIDFDRLFTVLNQYYHQAPIDHKDHLKHPDHQDHPEGSKTP